MLAQLVRNQRRSIRKDFLNGPGKKKARRHTLMLLRLAVTLHRGRGAFDIPLPTVRVREDGLTLSFARGWLAAHPLTERDLVTERVALEAAGLRLAFE